MLFFYLFDFSFCRTYVFIHIYYSDVPAEFPPTVLQSSVFNNPMLLMKCNTFSFLSDISTTSFFIPCSFVSFSSNDTISRPTPFPVISGLIEYMELLRTAYTKIAQKSSVFYGMYFSDVLCGVINDGNLKSPRTTEK